MIKIAGAGISGLTAAINLARNGYEVEVYEKNQFFSKENICAVRNYDLPFDALEEFKRCGVKLKPKSKTKNVVKFSPNYSIKEKSKKAIFYIFERGPSDNSIENQLRAQAEALGVKIFFGKPIEEKEADIIATGCKRQDIFAYGHIYENLDIVPFTSYIIYNNLYAPNGYIYVLTADEKTMIASVSFDKKKFKYIPVNFSLLLRKNDFLRDLIGEKEPKTIVSGFGNYDIPKKAKINDKYYVGERGFFMDSSKGFGIRYAIITGHLAAKAIIEGDDYDKLWKKEIKNEIERNFKRRLWLNKLTNMDYDEMLKRMGNEVNIEKYLKETRQNKRHIDLLFPLYLMKWRIARSFS